MESGFSMTTNAITDDYQVGSPDTLKNHMILIETRGYRMKMPEAFSYYNHMILIEK